MALKPGPSVLDRVIGEQRRQARARIFSKIAKQISDELKSRLDELLVVGDGPVSELQRLRNPPGVPSAGAHGIVELLSSQLHCHHYSPALLGAAPEKIRNIFIVIRAGETRLGRLVQTAPKESSESQVAWTLFGPYFVLRELKPIKFIFRKTFCF